MTKISGSCLCGGVTYEGDIEPVFMGNCHCTDCRKASASGHMCLMAVPADSVTFKGEISSYALNADSGSQVTHNFCPTCGSQMYNKNTNMEGVTVVVASTLDNPEAYKPQVTVYASRALPWDKPDPDTQQFDEMPPRG